MTYEMLVALVLSMVIYSLRGILEAALLCPRVC
jgi:hypothetical protein